VRIPKTVQNGPHLIHNALPWSPPSYLGQSLLLALRQLLPRPRRFRLAGGRAGTLAWAGSHELLLHNVRQTHTGHGASRLHCMRGHTSLKCNKNQKWGCPSPNFVDHASLYSYCCNKPLFIKAVRAVHITHVGPGVGRGRHIADQTSAWITLVRSRAFCTGAPIQSTGHRLRDTPRAHRRGAARARLVTSR
jgi:hypothetical protein